MNISPLDYTFESFQPGVPCLDAFVMNYLLLLCVHLDKVQEKQWED